MANIIHLPVLIDKLATLKDGSVKVSLETRELPADQMTSLFNLRNQEAWCLLSANQIDESEVPKEKADPVLSTKTASQRMRNVIYILYKQGGMQGDFESYYNSTMERIIETLKDRIEG